MGIGVDIEKIERFKNLPFRKNKNFYEKIFTEKEIEYCLKMADPYPHFAARFCAKEAAVKAVDRKTKDLRRIEVKNAINGRPIVQVEQLPGFIFHTSLTHTREYAAAVVIACAKSKHRYQIP